MIECVALMAMYAVLIFVALFSIYHIYRAVMEILREMLEEIHDERIEGIGKEEKEKHDGSGPTTRGAKLSGSNGGNAEEEEGDEWQKKKS